MAGNTAARARILQLIRRYGAPVVNGVMKRILTNGGAAFLDKLSRLPDGTWRDRTYVECCRPGDRGAYRVKLSALTPCAALTNFNTAALLAEWS